MKIKVWSDLHLEFRRYLFDHIHLEHPDDKETTLCLSGDISTGRTARPFILEMCKHFKYVLLICGNHEYYHNDFHRVNKGWADFEENEAPDNFHFLYNDWRVLDGVRFLGTTMWTGFNDGNPITMNYAEKQMNDYEDIRVNDKVITPQFIKDEHDKSIQFLLKKFNELHAGPTVVMTHHSPGNEVKRRGRQEHLGPFYFADIEKMIGDYDCVKLWTHGHIHENWDYLINNTRVVCNPYGYWGYATNPNFDRGFLVEV